MLTKISIFNQNFDDFLTKFLFYPKFYFFLVKILILKQICKKSVIIVLECNGVVAFIFGSFISYVRSNIIFSIKILLDSRIALARVQTLRHNRRIKRGEIIFFDQEKFKNSFKKIMLQFFVVVFIRISRFQQKFLAENLLTKILRSDRNSDFRSKFYLLLKVLFVTQISIFWPKFWFLTKIFIFY